MSSDVQPGPSSNDPKKPRSSASFALLWFGVPLAILIALAMAGGH